MAIKNANGLQVQDDPDLLELMVDDNRAAPSIYQPTNYWAIYQERLLPYLKKTGLRNFRRSAHTVFESFGAADKSFTGARVDLTRSRGFNNRVVRHLPGWQRVLGAMNAVLPRVIYVQTPYSVTADSLRMLVYEHARLTGERAGAHPVKDLEVSLAGNPEDAFVINGRVITMNALERYLRYAYCFARHRSFDDVAVIAELGGGSGTQVEVIKRLHPNVCFLMFDLPLQLYVCQQYLSTAFPDSVISYRETRAMKAFPAAMEGKILFFGTHQFPIIADANVDLFWNSSSFQEMEPDVVGNYLSYVNDNVRAVYLKENMDGKELAKRAGSLGVLEQTTLQHYKAGLSKLKIDDISPVLTQTGDMTASSESFWTLR